MRWLALSALLLAVGCERAPDDPVFFFGNARTASGAPLPGARVELLRAEGTTCYRDRLGSLRGLPPPEVMELSEVEQLGATSSSETGSFLLRLFGYQVAAGLGGASECYLATLEHGPAGASSLVSFGHFSSDVVIEDFYRWDDGVLQAEGSTVIPSSFPIPPSETALYNGPIPPNLFAYGWELSAGEELLWRERATGKPLDLSNSRIEETEEPLTVHLDLLAELTPEGVSPFTGVGYRLIARSAPLPLTVAAPIPLSRGSTCHWGDAPPAPCPLTDGQFVPVQFSANPEQPNDAPLHLTLPRPAHLTEVVLRGYSPGFDIVGHSAVLDGSADGKTWTTLLELPFLSPNDFEEAGPYTILGGRIRFERHGLPTTEAPIQHLRITGTRGLSMSELSFFE